MYALEEQSFRGLLRTWLLFWKPITSVDGFRYFNLSSLFLVLPVSSLAFELIRKIIIFMLEFVDFILQHKYNTLSILPSVSCPVLLIHAEDDFDIQIFHSQHLFDAMLEPLLESYPFTKQELSQITMKTKEQQELFNEVSVKRRTQAASFVSKEGLTGLGNLFTFRRGDGKGAVHFLRSQYGGHNQIINFEGVMDVARNVFNL